MSIKKVRQFNGEKFLDDLKSVRDVMVIPEKSNVYLHITKRGLLREAETCKIVYYITDEIFKVKRNAMVIT